MIAGIEKFARANDLKPDLSGAVESPELKLRADGLNGDDSRGGETPNACPEFTRG
jgi:hypothetical protein